MKAFAITQILVALMLCQVVVGASPASTSEADLQEREQRMQWWRDARFGMFVHWGLYSALAGEWKGQQMSQSKNAEWIQEYAEADTESYAAVAIPKFHPKPGFATEWAKAAKQAGCRYLVFTTKHHDGFALHDSQVSEFDAGSVLKRDLVREIVEACRVEGLRIGFYYSVIDWHHDQFAYADSEEIPHPLRGKPYPNRSRDHQKYIDYLHAQVDELTTNYGDLDIMWWDYSVTDFQGQQAWNAPKLIERVRSDQPQIIMNNRLYRRPESGLVGQTPSGIDAKIDPKYGDFMTPEQHVPDTGLPGADWETCMTMNNTWGYSKYDRDWKSTETLLHTLIDIASKGGNFLLNIGPTGDGSIPAVSVERLKEIGRWLEKNGEAIYGTAASPIPKPSWGRLTADSDRNVVYLHVFDWPSDGVLEVQGLNRTVNNAELLESKVEIPCSQQGGDTLQLTLPENPPDPIASVIRLQCSKR